MGTFFLLLVLIGVFGFAALFGDGLWEDKRGTKELGEILAFHKKYGNDAELPEHLGPAYKRMVEEVYGRGKRK